jgi:hypothetical protein
MRRYLLIALTLMASLAAASSAQAVVVNDGGNDYGVALVPGSSLPGGYSPITSGPGCADPGLPLDLTYQPSPARLCWHGGSVMHQNETFALTWDPHRRYWVTTRDYVEQFLKDVATGSNTFTSPFALTSQYWDGNIVADRAQNSSRYGGGCID